MPCIVCGKATKENSIICDDCLQKEIHQKKKKAGPLKTTSTPPKKTTAKPKPAAKSKPKSATFSFDSLLDDVGDTLDAKDDLEFNPETPAKPKAKKPQKNSAKKPADDLGIGMDDLFTSETPAPAKPEKPTQPDDSSDNFALDLDSDLTLEHSEPDEEVSLDLDAPADEAEKETEPDQVEPEEIDPDESDEDILKKKIKNRMQQKLTSMKPVEKKADPMDSLLDEVLMDEIEEEKTETPPVPKKLPTKKVIKKQPKPVDTPPKKKDSPAEKETKKEKAKDDELLSEILKPKKTNKPDLGISLSEGIKAEKKEDVPGFAKGKDSKTDSPFESSGEIIKGTTSRKKTKNKKEKSSKAWLWIFLFIVILGAGGYAVYEFVLKKDPIKVELLQLLENAKTEEANGNLQSAITIYQSIGPKFTKYPEAGNAPIKVKELQARFEEMKKSSEFQEKVNNILAQAKKQFDKNIWTEGRGKTALELYNEVLQLDSENSEAKTKLQEMENSYLKNGSAALQRKQYTNARNAFQKVLRINPDNITASTSLTTISTILEQQQLSRQENEKRQREQQRQQELAAQKKAEEQRQAAAEAQRQEALRIEKEKQAAAETQQQAQQNEMRNRVFLDALVDGGRRVYVKRVTAELPLSAKRTGIKGTVIVKVIVNNEGVPESVSVLKSDSEILSNAAMDAVRKYQYKPPTKDGNPCKMELTEIIKFR